MEKMNSQSKNQAFDLAPGTAWTGKWNQNPYKIIKRLGKGANGVVYLADTRTGQKAVKIGEDKMSLTSEVNVLRAFSKVQGNVLGPSLLDVDDVIWKGEVYPFFCMEYLEGETLLDFARKRGSEWIPVFMVQLLGDLDRLHQEGWIFGDLKPDNLIITGPPSRVRWFDVGGTTRQGRAVKEYTEFYDRGYWGLGDRRAEPSYDLFAAAMILIETAYPRRFDKPGGAAPEKTLSLLRRYIQHSQPLAPFQHVLLRALKGEYPNAQLMKKDLIQTIEKKTSRKPPASPKQKGKPHKKTRPRQRAAGSSKEKASYRPEIILTTSFLFLSSVLYFMGQWM
ncbi:serine/threonine protein kinase [Salibacterium halotolerans]|uniref:Serine/threonine protein kinase n=1 Tax=Salibacterium halotolerans TaxID=1884432 RepID=A0A1I5WKG1_9BACI|nr:serine/threonine protein kinase [Salibacterium halotolerans]SFQ20283.1 serine/threonine protein kinase [Salibacterium halotolerans]